MQLLHKIDANELKRFLKFGSVGLLGLSLVGYLLTTRPKRLLSRGFWLYALLATLFFSPVIVWNAQHQFVSFLSRSPM